MLSTTSSYTGEAWGPALAKTSPKKITGERQARLNVKIWRQTRGTICPACSWERDEGFKTLVDQPSCVFARLSQKSFF